MLTRPDSNRRRLVGHGGQAPLAAASSHRAAGSAIAAFFAGMAAGVFPAGRAAHLDPLQALKYE